MFSPTLGQTFLSSSKLANLQPNSYVRFRPIADIPLQAFSDRRVVGTNIEMSEKNDAWARLAGKGIYPVEYASLLLNPLRQLICPPWLLIRRMRLNAEAEVLEIGCGPGYFSPSVARVLPSGRLTIFDYQDGMLDIAEARLKNGGLANYSRQQGDAAKLPFASNFFDLAFMVTVLGEVGDANAALREALRVLKPGGRLSITEVYGDPDFVSPDKLLKLAKSLADGAFSENPVSTNSRVEQPSPVVVRLVYTVA